jgi:hypothetical protein
MAKKLQAKKITEALQKAQRVGEVEERFTVAGCEVVLRNLLPEEFSAVVAETDDLEEGLDYVNVFKKGHICRSLIELNGESLREYDFVEVDVEEPDPVTKQLISKIITLERHKFIYDYVLATWSREVVDVAYRKFLDVTRKSEVAAAEGVEFTLPDETPDERFRRLLVEVKDLEGHLPFELAKRILEEIGYVAITSKEEREKVDEVLSKAAGEVQSGEGAQEAPPTITTVVEPVSTKTDLKSLLQTRTPLNQRPVAVPQPVPQPISQSETQPIPVESQPVTEPRTTPGQVIPPTPAIMKRAQDIGALEGFDPNDLPLGIQGGSQFIGARVEGIPILGEQQKPNEDGVLSILNKPSQGALNPRYRPPNKF